MLPQQTLEVTVIDQGLEVAKMEICAEIEITEFRVCAMNILLKSIRQVLDKVTDEAVKEELQARILVAQRYRAEAVATGRRLQKMQRMLEAADAHGT